MELGVLAFGVAGAAVAGWIGASLAGAGSGSAILAAALAVVGVVATLVIARTRARRAGRDGTIGRVRPLAFGFAAFGTWCALFAAWRWWGGAPVRRALEVGVLSGMAALALIVAALLARSVDDGPMPPGSSDRW